MARAELVAASDNGRKDAGEEMSLEIVSGVKKYRINHYNPRIVDVQHKHRGTWVTYAIRDTAKEARELLLQLARGVKGEKE